MRIAIIAHCLYPIKEPYAGGLEMITHLLCDELISRGHKVDLYAHRESETKANLFPFLSLQSNLNKNDHNLAEECGVDQRFLEENIQYSKILNDINSRGYDIVHNHSLHFQPLILGNLLNKPIITTLHTPPFPWLKMGALAIKGNANHKFISVSRRLGEIWSDYISEYEVVYNGINLTKWSFNTKKERKYLVFAGRLCKEKGVEIAIQFALCAKIPLKILGPVSDQQYFDEQIKKYLDHPLIEYVGHKEQREINLLFSEAIGTLFFSTWEEPYGLVIAESLASGTPVVAFNKGAAPEILTAKTGVLLDPLKPYNPKAIIKQLRTLNGFDCRNRAEDFCSSKNMIDNYETLYMELSRNSITYDKLLAV